MEQQAKQRRANRKTDIHKRERQKERKSEQKNTNERTEDRKTEQVKWMKKEQMNTKSDRQTEIDIEHTEERTSLEIRTCTTHERNITKERKHGRQKERIPDRTT